jgi:hypothetical protein
MCYGSAGAPVPPGVCGLSGGGVGLGVCCFLGVGIGGGSSGESFGDGVERGGGRSFRWLVFLSGDGLDCGSPVFSLAFVSLGFPFVFSPGAPVFALVAGVAFGSPPGVVGEALGVMPCSPAPVGVSPG